MLLQTNSYIVPKDKRAEHARLMARFRQCFRRLGSGFEVYEQTGPGFAADAKAGGGGGRFVQMMRFNDRRHQQEVHERERSDGVAQRLIAEFCQLVNLPYQQQQGLFAAGFYAGVLTDAPPRDAVSPSEGAAPPPSVDAAPDGEGDADGQDDPFDDLGSEDDTVGGLLDEAIEEDDAARSR